MCEYFQGQRHNFENNDIKIFVHEMSHFDRSFLHSEKNEKERKKRKSTNVRILLLL